MLSDILKRMVAKPASIRELRPREILFRRGERAEYVYMVESGRITLARNLKSGKSVVLHVAHESDSFSGSPLLSDYYHCDAIADVASRVRTYVKTELIAALRRDPALALEYTAYLSEHIQRLCTLLELRNIQSARERIFQYLLQEASADSSEIEIRTTLKDVAARLGLTHEAFYRELAALEQDHVIERREKTIKLLKLDCM